MAKQKLFKRVISLLCTLVMLLSFTPNIMVPATGDSTVNHCLKVVTGAKQWEGVKISAANLGLELGHDYQFSMKVYTPDIPVGIVAQTADYNWVASAGAGSFNQNDKKWNTVSGTISIPAGGTLSNYDISIVKIGDSGNYDSQVATFYLDDIIVTDITNGANNIVFNENFESSTHNFTSGGATISIVTDPEASDLPSEVNHCLKVVTGTKQWEGVKISAANLGLELGHDYQFSMKVYTPDIPVGIVAQTADYNWVASAGAGSFNQNDKKWNTVSGTIGIPAGGTLSNYDISIVKIGDSGNYDSQIAIFYLDDVIVTDITGGANNIVFNENFEGSTHNFTSGGATISIVTDPEASDLPSEPSEDNHCLKIVTGVNQWEGANIRASELGLVFGKKYTFSLKVYTPNKAVGITLQHSDNWIHIIDEDFFTPEVEEWRTISGTFDLTDDPFDFENIQIVKTGGKVNDDEAVTLYIDDFIVANADSREVVYSEDFEGKSNKFTSGGATLSVVKESVIYEEVIEDPITGEYALDVAPLKDIYEDYFLIGNIVNSSDFGTSATAKERYEIFKYHYNVLTFENAMKPDHMWNSNNYNVPISPPSFSVDQYIEKMQEDGFLLHGHALAWHGQSPDWLHLVSGKREATTGADQPVYKTYAEANANLINFVSTIAGHYYNNSDGLEVYSWDVLNEAVRRNTDYAISEETWGYHTIGHIFAPESQWNSPWYLCYQKDAPAGVNPWDYVYDLFLYSRQADPNAILYYNDYGMEDPDQVKMVVNMVNAVNKRYAAEHPEAGGRLLIEGIGMQEHDTINTNLTNVENAIKAYIETGCIVSISELDVGVPGYKKGEKLTPGDEIKQALYYAKLFNIFKKYSDGIERVTFWGLDDNNSWRSDEICLVFDGKLNTKLAYYAIADPDTFIEAYDTTPVIPTDSLESTAAYGTPVVGNFEDELWDTTEALPIVRHLNVNYGATGTAKVLWDEENLYVQIKVNDSLLNKSNANVWEQDSVEVFFNETNSKSINYTDGMGQYRINYDNLLSTNLGGSTSIDGFESYTKIISGGYMVEIKIPFQFHNPAIGEYIGFDAQINDANDEGVRYNAIMWSDTSGESYAKGDDWGSLKLVKEESTPTTPPTPTTPTTPPTPTTPTTPPASPTPTTPTKPTIPANVGNGDKQADVNSDKIAVTVNGSESYTAQIKDNTVTVSVPAKSVNDSIDKLAEELKTDTDKEQVIELKLSGAPNMVNKASFSLPNQAVADIIEKTDASLKIDVDHLGSLIISNEALSTILETGNGDIRIVIESVAESKEAKLNKAQKETVGDNPVYDFSVNVGSRKVSDFGAGSIKVILPYTPADDMNLGAIIVYYVDSKGNLQEVINSSYDKESGTVSFTVSHFSIYMIAYNYKTFIDIDNNSAKAKIEYAAARGLLKGVAEGIMYLPNQKITRGEYVQMLQNILKVPHRKDVFYEDLGMNTQYYSAIMCFKDAGLLDGVTVVNNQFKPDVAITREEMTAILANIVRYKGIEPESYVDLNMIYADLDRISDEYVNDVRLAVSCGLMNYTVRMPDGMWRFSAKSAGTRQQAARIQVNLLGLLKKNNIFR